MPEGRMRWELEDAHSKKIEELNLYMLELKKENEWQERQIEELMKQNKN